MPKFDYTIEQWSKRGRDFMPCSCVCVDLHVLVCAVCANNGDGVKENSRKKKKNIVFEDLEHEIVKIYVRRYWFCGFERKLFLTFHPHIDCHLKVPWWVVILLGVVCFPIEFHCHKLFLRFVQFKWPSEPTLAIATVGVHNQTSNGSSS